MLRIALLLLCLVVTGFRGVEDRIRVVTTLPILAHWVSHIAGDRVEIATLLPGPEVATEYEPAVDDVKALARARVLVRVGSGLEPWLDELVRRSRNSELLLVDASPISDHDGGDGQGYVWLDPERAALVCSKIARELEIADSFAGTFYQARERIYVAEIQAAARRVRGAAAGLSVRRLTGGDPHWETLARALGLEWVPQPSSPDGIDLASIAASGARLLLVGPGATGDALAARARAAGLQVLALDPAFDPTSGIEYPAWYEQTAGSVVTALGAISP